MATLTQLTERTLGEIGSYVRNQESVTISTNAIDSDDLVVTVDDAAALSKGIVEIDDELLYVKKSVAASGTIQILGTSANPSGRGWRGTTATSHVSGSIIRNNPIFPKSQIKNAILDTIKGMNFPVIKETNFDFTGSQYAYSIPDEVVNITGVSWELPDSTGVWALVKRWRIDTNYYDEDTNTYGRAIVLNEAPMAGARINVQYTAYPTVITDNQELTVSGLPASCEDVVRLGAMYRLLSTIDPGKVISTSVSADAMDQPVSAGASTNAAKYIFQLYTVRLAEEVLKQQANFLNTIQYSR